MSIVPSGSTLSVWTTDSLTPTCSCSVPLMLTDASSFTMSYTLYRILLRENAAEYRRRLRELRVKISYVVGDPSIQNTSAITRTSIQTEYVEHGVPIALGNNDVRGGIARVQNRFAKRLLFVSRRCRHTLRELNNYRWDRYASTKIEVRRNKKETPLKRNDHCMDALRYGVMSRPAYQDELDESVGNVLNLPEAGEYDFDYELMFSGLQVELKLSTISWVSNGKTSNNP